MQDPKYPDILISNEGHTSDSCHHTAYYYIMNRILGSVKKLPIHLYYDVSTGYLKRHPDREITSGTRDQFTAHLTYCALYEQDNPDVLFFYELVMRNGGFFFNSVRSDGVAKKWWDRDWLDIQTRGLYWRMRDMKRWMQLIGDFNLCATVLYKDWFKPDNNADDNLLLHLIVARVRMPSRLSKWAWNYYLTKTKKKWDKKIFDFFDRGGTYYPELVDPAITAVHKLQFWFINTPRP